MPEIPNSGSKNFEFSDESQTLHIEGDQPTSSPHYITSPVEKGGTSRRASKPLPETPKDSPSAEDVSRQVARRLPLRPSSLHLHSIKRSKRPDKKSPTSLPDNLIRTDYMNHLSFRAIEPQEDSQTLGAAPDRLPYGKYSTLYATCMWLDVPKALTDSNSTRLNKSPLSRHFFRSNHGQSMGSAMLSSISVSRLTLPRLTNNPWPFHDGTYAFGRDQAELLIKDR